MEDKTPNLGDLFGSVPEEEAPTMVSREDLETPEGQALRAMVLTAMRAIVERGQAEIEEEQMDIVADELSMAAMEAKTPRHILRKLRHALVNSEGVEEVYATDRALEAAFRRALEG